jgi:UDP-N-acetylmuramyl pentapeptide phosphotransferase/UDP-N-acetylglucosamine-1-phosphate transferase
MIYISVLLISFLLTWVVKYIAVKKSIIDIPNDRSSHVTPTPRGGGLAVVVAFFMGLTYCFFIGKINKSLFYALLSGLPLTLIGFADDVISLKPGVRFLVQFICAGVALFFLGGLQSLTLATWNLNLIWLFTPVAFIAIIWSINLFNFLDGIDGYIGSEIIFLGLGIFLLTSDNSGILLAISVSGFLIWNWPKAKIFMGDVGSTFLGFAIAIIAIHHQNTHVASMSVWLILTSVFWFDATITVIRRTENKEKLSQAHRKHAYQRIVQAGWSHQSTVFGAFLLNIMGFGLAWLAKEFTTFSLAFLGIDIIVLFVVLKLIDRKKPFDYQ